MKKTGKILYLLGIAAILTACGQKSAPAGNLAQDIKLDADSLKNSEENGKETEETAVSDQKTPETEKAGVFSFEYEGVSLTPGEPVDHSTLPEYSDVAEVPSCAFGGNDNVYHYDMFELTAYFDENVERIYAIYFIDPNLPTTEGLSLGDTVDDMVSLYGEDYTAEENVYTYTRGETSLIFITKNDIIVSIEYCLNR